MVSDELEALMPSDPRMRPAWLGCLSYTLGAPERIAEFRADTGNTWTPGKSPIDRMVDQATGAELAFLLDLARWMNANVWGEVDGRACNGNEPLPPDSAEGDGLAGGFSPWR